MEKGICHISKTEFEIKNLIEFKNINPMIRHLMLIDFPDFSEGKYVSLNKLAEYRRKYLERLIKKENKELNKLEKEVLNSIQSNSLLSENIEIEISEDLSVGQKIADQIATFGGSWTFIIIFFSFLIIWMGINIWIISTKPFDPYPFILLNLILSCLAAIQAPIIMMSQNRKEQKDRARSENDFKVNLKAELEIRLLHEKLDHLIIHQNKHLLDIQELQLDYLEEIAKNQNDKKE